MAAAAILKNHKNRDISRNGLTDFYEIWYADAKWALGLLTSPTAKEFEFHKSKMAIGRHFLNR